MLMELVKTISQGKVMCFGRSPLGQLGKKSAMAILRPLAAFMADKGHIVSGRTGPSRRRRIIPACATLKNKGVTIVPQAVWGRHRTLFWIWPFSVPALKLTVRICQGNGSRILVKTRPNSFQHIRMRE